VLARVFEGLGDCLGLAGNDAEGGVGVFVDYCFSGVGQGHGVAGGVEVVAVEAVVRFYHGHESCAMDEIADDAIVGGRLGDEVAVDVVDITGGNPVASGPQPVSGPVVAEGLGVSAAADPGEPVLVVKAVGLAVAEGQRVKKGRGSGLEK